MSILTEAGTTDASQEMQDQLKLKNKEAVMSDYIEELLDITIDDYEDDVDDAVEM
ncbi:hypothetical protein [Thalassolituus sp.]|uniref:hypothetical protein n=1 Tax=Thalassolituus sp. TaxID=2030822 RepID=UPI002A832378|nr:hypothetical protein [Thalassolituus sp.]